MIRETLQAIVTDALASLGIESVEPMLTHPDELEHGDFATNAALVAAHMAGEQPRDVAENIAAYVRAHQPDEIERVDVAGPGFVNFYLSPTFFADSIHEIMDAGDAFGRGEALAGRSIMVEHTQPNVLKVFHLGHLMSNCIGESLTRLFEAHGARVVRANYQGDVGMHVAKALWGIKQRVGQQPVDDAPLAEQTAFIGDAYVAGAAAYEEDEEARREIKKINALVYAQSDAEINKLYQWGRKVSLDHFEEIYAKLGTRFDHYFFESDVAYDGTELVEKHLKEGVFETSEDAVIFDAEKHGLHKRVFINSDGLPTYEAKDLGLNVRKFHLEPKLDRSLIITANEQDEYFKVVLKALEKIAPEIAEKTEHISHGMMRFPDGKMSSRKGNVVTGESLVNDVEARVRDIIVDRDLAGGQRDRIAEQVGVAAVKYMVLRQSIGRNIAFDIDTSVSFEGDSGPYLQYTYTRASAVIEKARERGITPSVEYREGWQTTDLEHLLYQFPEIVERAAYQYAPHHLTTYLTRVASTFNAYYATERIVETDDALSPYKIALTYAVRHVMKNGLYLLGIEAPERM